MKKIILSVLALIVALMSTVVAVFGWLAVGTQIEPNYTGSVISNYFASGDGSEGDAFIINRPNHLYNLAWLQNNGYFGSNQYYFKITADLDMSGYVLPPIGTKDNPFIGNLDGKIDDGTDDGKICTIYNLTVSNVISDSSKPNEVSRVPKVYNENAIGDGDTDIVGFFGVIGHHPDSTCNAKTLTNKVSVSNLYLDNLTVRTRTSNTLIGLFAGYVCGNVSDIGVCRSLVSIGSEAKVLNENYSNHSNYSLIGDYHKASTGWAATDTGSSGGEEGAGFGGSIDMKLLSRRVGYMITSMLKNNENSGFKNTNYNYLVTYSNDYLIAGGCLDTNSQFNLNVYKGGSSSLSVKNSGFYYQSASLTQTSNTYLEGYFGNGTYLPLNINLAAMNLAATDSTTDQNYGEELTYKDGTKIIDGTYYYNDKYKYGISEGENQTRKEVVSASNTGYIVGGAGGDTYTTQACVRLRISNLNYGNNTDSSTTLNSGEAGRTIYKSLNYEYDSSSMTYSGTVTYDGSNLYLVTNMDGTFYRIKDGYNKNASNDQITNTEVDVTTNSTTKPKNYFVRYDDVRAQLHTLLSSELIYGMSFIKKWSIEGDDYSTIDTTTLDKIRVVGKDVSIDGKQYDSYEFIKSAINFNLSQSGYMTAILGGYSHGTNNQYGFSLYKVDRVNGKDADGNETDKIKKIKKVEEITSVWINGSGNIQYNLSDTTGYTKVYDSSWYNADGGKIQPGTAYYIEIPLLPGDYCLGGVSSSASAYLMYLDIGANGSSSGSSGSETDTDYKIDNVRFVYNSITTGFDFKSLETLYMFQIVYQNGSNGVHVYFLMTSSEMCYYVTIDTENTQVKLTNESLSATNSVDLSDGYGGTKEAPS
ncbi:MAG: hypothetical protein ACI4QI_04850 [Candidatus Coproplasma sp.]